MARFIVFEGIDGSGKTTQISLLKQALTERGIACQLTCEPTEAAMGRLLRKYLKGEQTADPRAVAALFAADRLDHITAKDGICDMLSRDITVICDRYYLSSYAYQGGDCGREWVIELNKKARELAKPDVHIFLDIPAEQSMKRVTDRGEGKEIYEKPKKQKQIRKEFLQLFDELGESENILVIDACRSPEKIAEDIISKIEYLF